MEPGKYYLIVSPFFMTYVGRFVEHLNFRESVIDNALYFTRTGVTFDRLCATGMVSESVYHSFGDGVRVIIPFEGSKFPWRGPTPWVGKGGDK